MLLEPLVFFSLSKHPKVVSYCRSTDKPSKLLSAEVNLFNLGEALLL